MDADDGDKIVGNVFGSQRDQVVNQLGSQGGGDSGLIGKLLPLLAPIVMSYLAKQMSSRSTQGGGGGGLTDILGSVLGGGGGGKGAGGLDIGAKIWWPSTLASTIDHRRAPRQSPAYSTDK